MELCQEILEQYPNDQPTQILLEKAKHPTGALEMECLGFRILGLGFEVQGLGEVMVEHVRCSAFSFG